MKKKIWIILLLQWLAVPLWATVHPSIYVSDADRPLVKEKIEHCAWAKEAYHRLKDRVDPYVERHRTDPQWIVSRIAMYWKEGERYTQCYHWFKKLRKIACSDDFRAVWNITSGGQPLSMQMWMTGAQGRELYAIEALEPVSASVYREKGGWFCSSTGKATVRLGKKVYRIEAGYHQPLN